MSRIIELTAFKFGERTSALLGKRRSKYLCRARHVAMLLCRSTGRSFPEVGEEFGLHHTTIMSGCKRAEELVKRDSQVARYVLELLEVIKGEGEIPCQQ